MGLGVVGRGRKGPWIPGRRSRQVQRPRGGNSKEASVAGVEYKWESSRKRHQKGNGGATRSRDL